MLTFVASLLQQPLFSLLTFTSRFTRRSAAAVTPATADVAAAGANDGANGATTTTRRPDAELSQPVGTSQQAAVTAAAGKTVEHKATEKNNHDPTVVKQSTLKAFQLKPFFPPVNADTTPKGRSFVAASEKRNTLPKPKSSSGAVKTPRAQSVTPPPRNQRPLQAEPPLKLSTGVTAVKKRSPEKPVRRSKQLVLTPVANKNKNNKNNIKSTNKKNSCSNDNNARTITPHANLKPRAALTSHRKPLKRENQSDVFRRSLQRETAAAAASVDDNAGDVRSHHDDVIRARQTPPPPPLMPRVDIRASVQALAHERLLEARQVWQVLSHANDIGEQRAVLRRFLSAKPAEELRRAAIRRKELTWLIVEMSSAATPDVQPDGWTPEVEAMKPEVTASEGVSATSDLHGGQSGDAEPVMPSLRRYHPDYPITGGLDEGMRPRDCACFRFASV